MFLSKYDFGSLNNLENIFTLKSIITLFETQELSEVEVKANNELKAITAKRIIEYKNADSLDRSVVNKLSTIRPVISGIAVSNEVERIIKNETKINFPK